MPITAYRQFLAGSLPLATPTFATVAENVNRFLVSNGVLTEGATRKQVVSAMSGTPSLFERIRRPDETLSQTVLRFRTCLVGVGWTPRLQRLWGQLKLGSTIHHTSVALFARQMFEGGLKTFDDAGERSDAFLAQIAEFETVPAKEAKAGLRRLARKIPRAGLGEHAAVVWLALLEAMERKIPLKGKIQWRYYYGLPQLISQSPLGMSAPKVLQALCAKIDRLGPFHEYRSNYLIDVAMAANRLGWPQISEILLDEVRPSRPSAFRIFESLIETMEDPERKVRLYLKWLPTPEELKTNRYDPIPLAESLARSGLGPRVREGAFFEMFLEGLPPVLRGPLRADAIAQASDVLDFLPFGYEEKKRLFKKLLAATQGIEPIDRRAAAVLRIADRVADPKPNIFHPRLSQSLAPSTAETIELLTQCMAEATDLPAEHPATNSAIRHIGRHLARYGAESGYPREAFTVEDREFMEDPK